MTLTEALAALKAAGKIKSAWLPGMRGVKTNALAQRVDVAVIAINRDGSALVLSLMAGARTVLAPVLPVSAEFLSGCAPELDDPATLGCLLALVREASGDPRAYLSPLWTMTGWCCVWHEGDVEYEADTEGEAIAAALIRMAGGAA